MPGFIQHYFRHVLYYYANLSSYVTLMFWFVVTVEDAKDAPHKNSPAFVADEFTRPRFAIFAEAVTNAFDDANTATNLAVFELTTDVLTLALLPPVSCPERVVSVASGAPPVPIAI